MENEIGSKIIRYVAGIPKGQAVISEDFDTLKQKLDLKENKDVWKYCGPLSREDFTALQDAFCSDQFHQLKGDGAVFLERLRKALYEKQAFTQTTRITTEERKYDHIKPLVRVSKASREFIGELEKAIAEFGMPACANDALNYMQKNAENRGLYVPISYSYATNEIKDLSYDTETLVFVDNKMCGKISLKKGEERPYWGGERTEEGEITIDVLGQNKKAGWNDYQYNSLRWIVDPIIREQILDEKGGVNFTRL